MFETGITGPPGGYTGIGVTGDVLIYGNLLVTGGIDPTYLALTPQASGPVGFTNPLWVDSVNGNALRSEKILSKTTSTPLLFTQMSDAGFLATDATGSPQYDAVISASAIAVSTSNGDSNTLTAGGTLIGNATNSANFVPTAITLDDLTIGTSSAYQGNGISITNPTTSLQYSITNNMPTNHGYAKLDLTSGDLTTIPPRAVLEAYADYTASPAYGLSVNKIDLGTATGDDIVIQNGEASPNDLPENTITLHQDGSYTNNYIKLRSAFDFVGLESYLNLGIDDFDLTIANQKAITIATGGTDPVVFRRIMSATTDTTTGAQVGLLENGTINATTTGTTNLTTGSAFATIINTPTTSTRIFVLPAPTLATAGYWYAFCNKSTAFTIEVQYPASTTIATIPVATNATNGGSVASFAVNSTGASYFAISNATTATNATNVEITSDNSSGACYIPFAKTSGNGQKPLFIDDVTGPLTYNPSTAVLSVGTATFTSQITLPTTTAAVTGFAGGTLSCNFGSFSTGVFSAVLDASMTAIAFTNPRIGGQYVIYVTVASGGPFTIASTLAGARTNYTTAVSVTTITSALLTVTYDGTRYIIACSAYN
jgi:hypothetical protein